jgi:hypothetical protein
MARDYGWLVNVLGVTVEIQRIRTCKTARVLCHRVWQVDVHIHGSVYMCVLSAQHLPIQDTSIQGTGI